MKTPILPQQDQAFLELYFVRRPTPMGIFFEPFSADLCCLCGALSPQSGEHKIKAAALRRIFGSDSMVIGTLESEKPLRLAQGPKSREFHFSAPLCGRCNNATTQPADKAFDRFSEAVARALAAGDDPASVFDLKRYAVGSLEYLNVFRYFAKLLSCHLAESGGPRSLQVTQFAIGQNDDNKVRLHIDPDPTYSDFAGEFGVHQYAAHGGLVVTTNPATGLINSFRTSLTLGPVRYLFWVEFGATVALALRLFHKPFSDKCVAAYCAALQDPMNAHLRRKPGI
jgi:hypothetical protein